MAGKKNKKSKKGIIVLIISIIIIILIQAKFNFYHVLRHRHVAAWTLPHKHVERCFSALVTGKDLNFHHALPILGPQIFQE